MSEPAVLAYSGGLDTSCAIAWLKEDYGFDEVVAVLVDVGQDADFEPAIARGHAAGADDVVAARPQGRVRRGAGGEGAASERALRGQVPAHLGALAAGDRRGGRASSRSSSAPRRSSTAARARATTRCASSSRFKASYPGVRVIAPLRDRIWTRDEEIAYALARGIPVEAKPESPYSIDDNLFGRAIEAGVLEDPWAAPPEDAFVLTASPAAAPRADGGRDRLRGRACRSSLDGEELPLAELVAALNAHAGAYGIGRIDMIENRVVGIKSRELYEAPAALTLIAAHHALEDLVLTQGRAARRSASSRSGRTLVYDGLWFSPLRAAIDAFVDADAGARRPARCGWSCGRRRRSSPAAARRHALYAESLASYGAGETFPHEAAEGFIRLAALEAELAAARARQAQRRVHDALVGRADEAAPRAGGLGSSSAPTTPSCCPYDCEATLRARAPAARRPGSSPTRSSREVEEGWPRSRGTASPRRRRRGRALGDRAPARRGRAQDPRGPLAQRPGRGGVPALRRWTPAPRRATGSSGFARAMLDARRGRGGHADARLHAPAARAAGHASATTCSPGSRCSSATASRFAARRGAGGAVARSARARSPARRSPPARRPERSAQLARRRRRPRLRARLPLRVRRPASRTSRGSARSSCLWATREFGFATAARRTRRRARR